MIHCPLSVNVMLWGTWIGRLTWDAAGGLLLYGID